MKDCWPERRRRHVVRLPAKITRGDGSEIATTITDLSLDGCCAVGSFNIGERIVVTVPRIGPLDGQIRWAFMGRAGIRFDSAGRP